MVAQREILFRQTKEIEAYKELVQLSVACFDQKKKKILARFGPDSNQAIYALKNFIVLI